MFHKTFEDIHDENFKINNKMIKIKAKVISLYNKSPLDNTGQTYFFKFHLSEHNSIKSTKIFSFIQLLGEEAGDMSLQPCQLGLY